MNSNDIEHAILEIGSLSGKNDKIAVLKDALEAPNFREAIRLMLDPRLRYGIAKKTLDKIEGGTGPNSFFQHDECAVYRSLMQMANGRLTGNRAQENLMLIGRYLDAPSWSLFTRILLKKPDAGFTASSVNKARKGTVWTFDCMLAHPFEEKRVKQWPVIVEPKIDGVRCLIMVKALEEGQWDIGFFSRTGKEFTAFEHMKPALTELLEGWGEDTRFILDCEIDSGTFLDTVSQARRKDVEALDAVARCFDIIGFEDWEKGKGEMPYEARRFVLEQLIGKDEPRHPRFQLLPQWECHSVEEIMQHNSRIQGAGGEGVIVKPKDHRYERKRSYSWLKVKGFETHDLLIKDVFEGEGKYTGKLGGLIVDYNGVDVRVGGGISDAEREDIWANPDAYIGRMIEVGAHETTPDGSLRHPRLIRWRQDRDELAA